MNRYDKLIRECVKEAGITLKSFDECFPYYRAVTRVVLAIEDTFGDENGGLYYDAYGNSPKDDEYLPPIMEIEAAANPYTFSGSMVIGDENLAKVVLSNVDRVEEIERFIRERKEFDPRVITEYLQSFPRVIASGSL